MGTNRDKFRELAETPMPKGLWDELTDLKVSYERTHTAIEGLTEKLDRYVEMDEERYRDLNESRVRHAELIANACAIIQQIKDESQKHAERCPNKDVVEGLAQVRTQGWLVKSMVALSIMAAFGGLFGTVNSCNTTEASEAQITRRVEKLEKSVNSSTSRPQIVADSKNGGSR